MVVSVSPIVLSPPPEVFGPFQCVFSHALMSEVRAFSGSLVTTVYNR